MGGGGKKIPYPKHVWSPAGGWYSQPRNWKTNTFKLGLGIFAVVAVVFRFSAENEQWARMPEPDRFFPSRYWSRQIVEHEKARKAKLAEDGTLQK